jgi:O-antigen/teichoic acid export membrane protein
MVRMMPKSDIGIWVLFTSVTAILEMIRNGFVRNPFITLLVGAEENDKASVITSSLGLHCILSVVISILLLLGPSARWILGCPRIGPTVLLILAKQYNFYTIPPF